MSPTPPTGVTARHTRGVGATTQDTTTAAHGPGSTRCDSSTRPDLTSLVARLVDEMEPQLSTYVRRRGDGQDVEDVVAEVWAAVWERRERLPVDPDERRALVFCIARNKVVDTLRRRERTRRLVALLQVRGGGVMTDPSELAVLALTAETLVARLPRAERAAMQLVVAGLSGAEGATALGCSPSAFSTRVERARRRVQRWWHTRDPGDADHTPPT